MKRRTFTLAGTGIAAVGLAVFASFVMKNDAASKYRGHVAVNVVNGEINYDDFGAKGAAQWWFDRMKDANTGELNFQEMARMKQLASQTHTAARNSSAASIQATSWNEIGPDNVGGRTRAMIIDRNNTQHMFAGAVSGGLWESFDGGLNWQKNSGFFSIPDVNINIASMAQASNGDLYVGTGEGMYYFFGTGAGGFIGGGVYKSVDGGATWSVLSATVPPTANNATANWVAVNKIVVDPNDPNHVFASTNKGLRVSSDGGQTWVTPAGLPATGESSDVDVPGNGTVITTASGKPWRSTDNGASFTNVGTSAQGFINSSLSRTEIGVAPSDPNFVYAFCASNTGALAGVYVSINGGATWQQAAGAGNAQFEPFGTGQGDYDNVVEVDPNNKFRAIFGGVELWDFELVQTNPVGGQWTRRALEFPASLFNPWYVHSDKHVILYHPTAPGTIFVGTDGGVFRSQNDGATWTPMNNGYNVTQAYSVAIDPFAPNRDRAMIGTQDNGTQYVNGAGNTLMSSFSTSGGDGGHCDISLLFPGATFQTVYYGATSRSNNGGQSSGDFFSERMTPAAYGQPGFAAFVTPIRLWESFNDPLSSDSITMVNDTIEQNKHVTTGATATYSSTLTVPTPIANPAATVILNSIRFTVANSSATVDGAGNISGDATGTVQSNGSYSITWNSTPAANQVIKAYYQVSYAAGTVFTLNSNVQGRTFSYATPFTINPNDTVRIQDPVQARLAVGFTGNNGIWITKRPLDFSATPAWLKIGGNRSLPSAYSGEASQMTWSPDGNYLFVGTAGGSLFRFSNIAAAVDSANGDSEANGGAIANPTCVITCHLIGSFSRPVTGLDVDPNNPNNVVVTTGNYGATQNVHYSSVGTTATSTTGTFVNKTGNLNTLGGVPCLSVSFDKYTPNRVLVGTEHGVFETSNITAATPTYVSSNANLDNVAIDMIRQQRFEPWHVPNAGCFYIGTHGRGIWRDDSSWQVPNSINEPSNGSSQPVVANDVKVFPNPVVDNSFVTFTTSRSGNAIVQIFDLAGKMVSTQNYQQLAAGKNTVEFNAANMAKGTYIIVITQDNKRIGSGRFVKM